MSQKIGKPSKTFRNNVNGHKKRHCEPVAVICRPLEGAPSTPVTTGPKSWNREAQSGVGGCPQAASAVSPLLREHKSSPTSQKRSETFRNDVVGNEKLFIETAPGAPPAAPRHPPSPPLRNPGMEEFGSSWRAPGGASAVSPLLGEHKTSQVC